MKEQDRADDLINRYVREVGRNLPRGQRADVQNELRSLLRETLDSRSEEQSLPRSQSLAADVLRDFGRPDEVADRYSPRPRYLIGPQLYGSFLTVLRVALPSMVGIALFVALQQHGWTRQPTTEELGRAFLDWLALSFQMGISALAHIVIIFAILQRLHHPTERPRKAWDPYSLPALDDPDRVSMTSLVLKMYAIVFFAALLNFYPGWVGIYILAGDRRSFISAGDLGIAIPMIGLNIWWIVAFWKNLQLARDRRWTPLTQWLDVGLRVFTVVILGVILKEVWYSSWSPETVSRLGEALSRILKQVLAITLTVAAVSTLAGALKKAWRLAAL